MLTEHILKIVNTSHQQLVHSKQGGYENGYFRRLMISNFRNFDVCNRNVAKPGNLNKGKGNGVGLA